jgi:hypothetical protein
MLVFFVFISMNINSINNTSYSKLFQQYSFDIYQIFEICSLFILLITKENIPDKQMIDLYEDF